MTKPPKRRSDSRPNKFPKRRRDKATPKPHRSGSATPKNKDRPQKPVTHKDKDRPQKSAPAPTTKTDDLIYGHHAVLAALDGERQLNRIWITGHLRHDVRYRTKLLAAKAKGTVIDEVDNYRLTQITQGATHQGVCAQAAPYEYWELEDLIQTAKQKSQAPVLVVIDSSAFGGGL